MAVEAAMIEYDDEYKNEDALALGWFFAAVRGGRVRVGGREGFA